MEAYEQDYDECCPKCDHSPTHSRDCGHCDDGYNDLFEEDPLWYNEGDMMRCDECYGSGVEIWCPNCGYNISEHNYVMSLKESK